MFSARLEDCFSREGASVLRTVDAEWLDSLPVADPRAIQSRRDLRKVNSLMGHPRFLVRELRGTSGGLRVVELGSGDGLVLLTVAKRLGKQAAPVTAVLVDRQPSVTVETRAAFGAAGWGIEIVELDVFDWLKRADAEVSDVTIANLFLHHFRDRDLADLLQRVAEQTRRFIGLEPRRSPAAVIGASLLGLVGCNGVTLHDGRVSVRAGFRDRELSALWPRDPRWRLREGRRGPFTHMFVADAA